MPPEQYVVTRDQGDWAVRYNGHALGRFASCPRAIRAAVEAAGTAHSSDERTTVTVERSPFDRYPVWVRGRDGLSQ
jgi:hypothetical protein